MSKREQVGEAFAVRLGADRWYGTRRRRMVDRFRFCKRCGLTLPHASYEDGIIECRDRLLEQRDEARDALRDALTWMGQTNDGDTEERRRILAAGWAALEGR